MWVALMDGKLDEASERSLHDHVETCSSCGLLFAGLGDAAAAERALASVDPLATTLGTPDSPAVTVDEARPGQTISRFLVEGKLGAGGMGVVYRAFDPTLGRRVALKLLHGGAARSPGLLLAEAQALAKLTHPNVVVIYEVGTVAQLSGDDRVFLAMEHVEGKTLRAWSPGRSTGEILDAYIGAGRGLAAAHAVGLVHRDFKPNNAMIGDDGRVRVLDFGLVRSEASADGTEVVGTPAYMAPEQSRGGGDARSDQFSFAISLWEALAGNRPRALAAGAELPSVRRIPARLRKALARGLQADPDRRFPTMDALLAELRRESARWPWLLAPAALAVAAGVFFVVRPHTPPCGEVPAMLANVWDTPRREALRAAFLATGAPYAATAADATTAILDRHTAEWTRRRTQACEATLVRHEQTAEVLELRAACYDATLADVDALTAVFTHPDADMVARAASVAGNLGGLDRCDDVHALQRQPPPPSTPAARATEPAQRAQIAIAAALSLAGKHKQALPLGQTAAAFATSMDDVQMLGQALQVVGRAQTALGDMKAAEDAYLRAAEAYERAGDDRGKATVLARLVDVVARRQGRVADGETYARMARAAQERAAARDLDWLIDDMESMLAIAEHDKPKALEYAQKALVEVRREKGDAPGTLAFEAKVAAALIDLGKYEEALAQDERVLAKTKEELGPLHPNVYLTLNDIGGCLYKLGKRDEAIAKYREALAVHAQSFGENDVEMAATYDNLGEMEFLAKKYDDAVADFEHAKALWEKQAGPDNPEIVRALYGIGHVKLYQEKAGEAKVALEAALALAEKSGKATGPDTMARVKYMLGRTLVEGELDVPRGLALVEEVIGGNALSEKDIASIKVWRENVRKAIGK
jgi:tetratricopeptide (TPR) repeat protein